MAEEVSRPERTVDAILSFVENPGLNEGETSAQSPPHCIFVMIVLDMDCLPDVIQTQVKKLTKELENYISSNITKAIEALRIEGKEFETYFSSLPKQLRLHQNPLNSCCGRETCAGGIYRLQNQGKEKRYVGVRLLSYLRRLLESRLLEKKYAAWYREGPPNNLSCWNTPAIA